MNSLVNRAGRRAVSALLVLGVISISGCGGVALTKYDDRTYQQVTFAKPEVLAVYDSFAADPIDETKISAENLKLAQLREYEAGKGAANAEMIQQVESIQNLFKRHTAERRRDGPWNETNLNNHKATISAAFDLAIKTEQAKNR